MKTKLLCLITGLMSTYMVQATIYNCSSVGEITTALASVVAGDEIIISAGTYESSASNNSSYYYSSANGTAANPITIRSASSSNRAHLKGNSISSKTVLRITGNYWIVKDLELSYAQKGLVFDNSNYSQAINCEVHTFGNEGIHVRDGSDYVTIDNCTVYDTGNVNPGFGEGIYIGTDKGSWSTYDKNVDYTTVKNCTIGPDVRAEAFDIKEGTYYTIVEYNVIDGKGIAGSNENFADSFIDLKGVRTIVRYNTFNQNNESNLTKGIAVIDRGVTLSAYEHVIHHNTFNMDSSSDNIVEAYGGTSDVFAVSNTRNPAGDMYNSRITVSCPSWYNACTPSSSNQSPTVSITSPSNNASFTAGDDILIQASANDSDGSVTKVKFYENGNYLGQDTSSPYSFTWNNVSEGNYAITAKATDDNSASTTSSPISVSVNASGGGGGGGSSQLSILYDCGDTNASNNKIKAYIKIVNDGSSSVAYDELTVRYWFTMEGSATPTFTCDYASIGKSKINGSFTNTSGSNYYLEVSINSSAGSLANNDDSGSIKLRVNKSDWSDHDETNDYSFDSSITSYTTYSNITLYQNGNLVWGNEPGSGARLSATIVTANQDNLITKFMLYPNPVKSLLNVSIPTQMENAQIKILSLTGQEVFSGRSKGLSNYTWDTSNLKKGYYLVVISSNEKTQSLKFLKQ